MRKKKVLFVCIHNGARSQVAKAFLNMMAPESFEAESAGIEPGALNPIVVDVMKDAGIDIASNQTKGVQDLIDEGRVLNTKLRFDTELARHKILDIIGDFYLLGRPLRGRIVAQKTGHSDNAKITNLIKEKYLKR